MQKSSSRHSGFFSSRALLTFLIGAAAYSIITGRLPAFLRPEATGNLPQRTLRFAERVAYQRAIEDVYWRHRIWPKDNPDRKPSLDAVMSQAQLEKKVEDYLLNSEAMEDCYKEPLRAEQLQSEMDRMAQHTRQPEVLRELFEALGNDPFVIAECLARPALAERMTTRLHVTQTKTGLLRPNVAATVTVTYTLPTISDGATGCIDDTWTATSTTNAPSPRFGHTAVWTGSEMIVWGGTNPPNYFNSGGRYNPSTDSWTPTRATNAPAGRASHIAIWTGTEMMVWGGFNGMFFNTGGRYNPQTDSWTAITTTNAPTRRESPTAVWTGSEMIVWGGWSGSAVLNTGGRYNPGTNSWTAISTTNAPDARFLHTAVWSGDEMIVWGGWDDGSNYFNTGGRYNPNTNTWTDTSTGNVPIGRSQHTAVWSGGEMIVWGGTPDGGNLLNTGGRYNPVTNNWVATSTIDAPSGRANHTMVWSGSEMIVWGGVDTTFIDTNTGGRYTPTTDTWTATTTNNAPSARESHTAVWTNSEMIVWGGFGGLYLNTGGRYCVQSASPTPTPTPPLNIRVTVQTNPASLAFSVDGTTYTSTQRFTWVSGSIHTIATTSPQSGGTGVQYVWSKWSDHGAISHIVAPTTNTTYTATFRTQYFLTMSHNTGGRVSPNSGWKNSGANVSISATPGNGFSFTDWTGTGSGSYSGTNNPASITMGGPVTETATFIHN